MSINAHDINAADINAASAGAPAYEPSWPLSLVVEQYQPAWAMSLQVAPYTLTPSWGLSLSVTTTIAPSWPLRLQVVDLDAVLNSQAYGWGYQASVGGVDVTARLTGPMSVRAEEGMAAIASWSLRPVAGPVDPTDYVGQSALLDYVWRDETGAVEQIVPLWQGVVDTVAVDPDGFVLAFTGVDRRDEILAAGGADLLPGSLWSAGVFDDGADALQQQEDRLSTLCASFDISPDGSPALTDWEAASTPHWTIAAGDYVWGSLGIELASHADLVQRVTATFDYRFSRLRLRETRIEYDFGGATQLAAEPICPPSTSLIDEAIDSTGLDLLQTIEYTTMSQQWYEFGGVWHNYPGYEYMVLFCRAYLGRRFAQSVQEQYTLTVDCADAGIDPRRSREVRGALESSFDAGAWESDINAEPVLDRPYLAIETILDATTDTDTGRAAADAAIETLLAQARRIIRGSHRSNRVTFATRLNPFITRAHTVQFDAAGVEAHGKVYRVEHTLNPDARSGTLGAYTTIALAISRPSLPDPTPSTLTAPTPPEAPTISTATAQDHHLMLGNEIGGKDTSPAWDEETMQGYVVNIPSGSTVSGLVTSWGYATMVASGDITGSTAAPSHTPYAVTTTESGPSYFDGEVANPDFDPSTVYPTQFRILSPAVEDAARDNLELPITVGYRVDVPTDTLTLTAP